MQLVYRAASYPYHPVAPTPAPVESSTVHTLMYRGQVYHSRKPVTYSAPHFHSLNWRFSSVCNPQEAALKSAAA